MRLHITPDCITVNIHESSSHFTQLSDTLSKEFSKTFWINEMLINLPNQKELKKRKEFLTSLYYTCAQASQTQNLAFLQKLIALHDKPIKIVRKSAKNPLERYYKMLNAHQEESLQSIRKKYLRLAKAHHPDLNTHNIQSNTDTFHKIQEAYEYVKAEKSRKTAA
jgi:hypothetical protein